MYNTLFFARCQRSVIEPRTFHFFRSSATLPAFLTGQGIGPQRSVFPRLGDSSPTPLTTERGVGGTLTHQGIFPTSPSVRKQWTAKPIKGLFPKRGMRRAILGPETSVYLSGAQSYTPGHYLRARAPPKMSWPE